MDGPSIIAGGYYSDGNGRVFFYGHIDGRPVYVPSYSRTIADPDAYFRAIAILNANAAANEHPDKQRLLGRGPDLRHDGAE